MRTRTKILIGFVLLVFAAGYVWVDFCKYREAQQAAADQRELEEYANGLQKDLRDTMRRFENQ